MKQILLFEPDKRVLKEIAVFLQNKGYTVVGVEKGASGIEKALAVLPDIILCNADLHDVTGHHVFETL